MWKSLDICNRCKDVGLEKEKFILSIKENIQACEVRQEMVSKGGVFDSLKYYILFTKTIQTF